MREIIFDTETTGLSPDSGDRIVEIGAVELDGLMPTGRTFHELIHPDRDMPAEAEKIHGISMEMLADKPRFADIADSFLAFIGEDANLVAHNASFDMNFLNAELVRIGKPKLSQTRVVDTLAMAKSKIPGAKLTLDALCNRFGIDLSRRVKHGALLDSELLADVYVELCGGRQRGMDLQADAPADDLAIAAPPQTRNWPKRTFFVSADEAERHRKFVAALDNPVWDRYADCLNS
ncbi:DNA polymerase III subunit epsilon [Pacificimonas sp. WHA3]|uniref:DNA polymerase III subunit epsilon n=1 Tax=Pacificimonas pallii TaxID=2827236 RepID=A0ABS6SCW8_9SPHN|nr:DNA polymerase III subunit epsilon [Pacificimonas pallii]MBV7255751.1 DNA polymerase III subunit epsilon [Pacificimonas pallii]